MAEKDAPTCHGCRYFYITWDQRSPDGCTAMRFNSRQVPAQVVYESSGLHCQLKRRIGRDQSEIAEILRRADNNDRIHLFREATLDETATLGAPRASRKSG